MVGAARVDADRQRVGVRIESDERVIRPGRAARILGECHGAMPGGEFDGKIMLPMLAHLLEIFASVRGRNLVDRTRHHNRSIFCAASSISATMSCNVASSKSRSPSRFISTIFRLPIARSEVHPYELQSLMRI